MTPNPRAPENLLEHAGYVRELARELVFDSSLAPDLEQEIWLAALKNVPGDLRHPRAWLATVARSLAWRTRRGTSRRVDRERRGARNEAVPSSEEVLEREELRGQVVRAVLALDEPYRSALVLRYLEELSPEAAAERLGVPLETLRTRVKRGLQELKRRLERDHGGDHGAWCLALVLELRLEPASTGKLVLKAGTAALTGGLVVSTAQKLIGSAAALVLLLLGLLVWSPLAPSHEVASVDAQRGPAALEQDGLPDAPGTGTRVATLQAPPTPVAKASAPRAAGTVRLHVEWSDGSPAQGIGVRLDPGQGDPQADLRDLRTDEHGDVAFDDVPAGVGVLNVDRGGGRLNYDLWSLRKVEKTVRLPPGVDLEGRVRTSAGQPVADARILLVGHDDAAAEIEVARSAGDGSFRIRNLVDARAILACREGFAASAHVRLWQSGGRLQKVELVLEAPGGVLAGRVLGPEGEPLRDALVVAGDPDGLWVPRLPNGNETAREASLAARTDALGAFRIDGLALGPNPVWVRAPTRNSQSLATWKGSVDVAERGTPPLEVRLQAGVEVSGRVSDAEGAALSGASVRTAGERGEFPMDGHSASTDPDGNFRLAGLSAGELELVASSQPSGETRTRFQAAPGAHLEWNPSLGKGLTLRGRVERAGRHTGTLDLRAWVMRDGKPEHVQEAYAFEDGRFEFLNCPDLPHHIEVYDRGVARQRLAVLDNARPGVDDVLLTLDPAAEPDARIHGRVLGADGQPVREAELLLFCIDPLGNAQEQLRSERGEFSVGPLRAGTWSLSIDAPGHARFQLEKLAIGRGEDRDAGTLQLVRGGTVHLRVRRADAQPLEFAGAGLRGLDGSSHDYVVVRGGEGRSRELPPGRYSMVVSVQNDPDLALASSTLEVVAGEEREFEVVLQRGVRVEIAWTDGRAGARDGMALFMLRDGSGATLTGSQIAFESGGKAHSSACLGPGRYRIESYPGGFLLDEFTLEAGASAPVERAITFRER